MIINSLIYNKNFPCCPMHPFLYSADWSVVSKTDYIVAPFPSVCLTCMKCNHGSLTSSQCSFAQQSNTLYWHVGRPGSIHPPSGKPPISQILGTDTCWENQSISGWIEEERPGQINVQILIRAAMQGDCTPSELILSFAAKIKNQDELLSKVYECVCVCADDKRDTITHWEIQIERGQREENKEGVEICSTDTEYHRRAQ